MANERQYQQMATFKIWKGNSNKWAVPYINLNCNQCSKIIRQKWTTGERVRESEWKMAKKAAISYVMRSKKNNIS